MYPFLHKPWTRKSVLGTVLARRGRGFFKGEGTTPVGSGFDDAVSDNATDGTEAIGDHGC